jgi:hypothetical protein
MRGWVASNPASAERRMIVALLDARPGVPVAAQYWASLYDVLFIREAEGEWVFGPDISRLRGREFIGLVHSVFTHTGSPFFRAVTAACRPLTRETRVYSAHACAAEFWDVYR